MSQAVTVVHLIAGTVTETTHTGQRVTCQHFADGRAVVKVYRDGHVVQGISYRNAEVVAREFELQDQKQSSPVARRPTSCEPDAAEALDLSSAGSWNAL